MKATDKIMDQTEEIAGLRREIRSLSEALDNIRIALGQEQTHYLVMASDVEDVVKTLEYIESTSDQAWEMREKARTMLNKLRQLNKPRSS